MTLDAIHKTLIDELANPREEKDYNVFLEQILTDCIKTILSISDDEIKKSMPLDVSKDILANDLELSKDVLLDAYDFYSQGNLTSAICIMREHFLSKQSSFKTWEIGSSYKWYRARLKDKNSGGFNPEEMFHIPFEKRNQVVNYRFSITGYPCLYLGNTILACWEEMHCPSLNDLVVSHVRVNRGKSVKVLDLRLPEIRTTIDLLDSRTEEQKREDNYLQLKTWPLIIACTIKTITPDDPFKFEYIHPQLLMLALKEKKWEEDGTGELQGIAFTSTQIDKNMSDDVSKYTNIAIPVKMIKTKGCCEVLSSLFSISRGVSFMEAEIKNIFCTTHLDFDEHEIVLEDYKDGTAPYEKTKFGQLENFISSDTIKLESVASQLTNNTK